MQKQRELGRGVQAERMGKGWEAELERLSGIPIAPANATSGADISKAVGQQFGPLAKKIFDDLGGAVDAAGINLDKRGNYILHTYRPEMDAAVKEKFGHQALRVRGPAGDAAWIAQTGRTRADFDAYAKTLFPTYRGKMSGLFLKWADDAAPPKTKQKLGGRAGATKREVGAWHREIPGDLDTKNANLKKLLNLDFDPLEADSIWITQEKVNRTAAAVGSRRALNVTMHENSYAGPKRNPLDWDAVKALKAGGLDPKTPSGAAMYHAMQGRHIPEQAAKDVARSIELVTTPAEVHKIIDTYRTWIKGPMARYLLTTPGYFTRNIAGSIWRALAFGEKSGEFLKYLETAADLLNSPTSAAAARTARAVTEGGAVSRLKGGFVGTAQTIYEGAKTAGRGMARAAEVASGGAAVRGAARGLDTVAEKLGGSSRAFGRGAEAASAAARKAGEAMAPGGIGRQSFDIGGKTYTRNELLKLADAFDFTLGTRGGMIGGSGEAASMGGTRVMRQAQTVPQKIGRAAGLNVGSGPKQIVQQNVAARLSGEAAAEATSQDDLWRLATALDNLAAGDTPQMVSDRIRDLFFNMDEFSEFERGASGRFGGAGAKDIFFFPGWSRSAIPWGLRALIERPSLYHKGYKAAQIAGQTGRRDEEIPEWMREQPAFINANDEGGVDAVTGFSEFPELGAFGIASDLYGAVAEARNMAQDPLGSIGRMGKRAVRPLVNMLEPVSKSALEWSSGHDFVMNRPIDEIDSMPDTWLARNLPGLNAGDAGIKDRVKVAARYYKIYRSIPPIGLALSKLGGVKRSGFLTSLASEFLPGRHYTYNEDLLEFMRGKDARKKWMENVWPIADDARWLANSTSEDPLNWRWTAKGKQEAKDLYEEWVKYRDQHRKKK